MILVAAILVGLIAGLCRAWIGKRSYRVMELKLPILVLLAMVPQYFAFFAPSLRSSLSNTLVSILLISSLVVLLVFSIFNIQKPGFWPICLGFFLNFLVILLNGGFMPISPVTAAKLSQGNATSWAIGHRFAYSKDIVLSPERMKLAFLSDRFTIIHLFGVNVAFSIGDVIIALGVVVLLWMLGGKPQEAVKERING